MKTLRSVEIKELPVKCLEKFKKKRKVLHKCILIAALTLVWQFWMQNQKQRGQLVSQNKELSALACILMYFEMLQTFRGSGLPILYVTVITPIWNRSFPPHSWEKVKLLGIYINGALIPQTLMHVPNARQHSYPTGFNSSTQMHVWKCLHA